MLKKLKNIFGDEKNGLDQKTIDTVNWWSLSEIETFLIAKKKVGAVPYSDAVLGQILKRFLELKRSNGEHEIEHKIYDKKSEKYIIPERTTRIIKIIQRITKSSTLDFKSNEIVFAIINQYTDENGKKEYEDELLPYYKMALERIMLKTEVAQGLTLEYGNKTR